MKWNKVIVPSRISAVGSIALAEQSPVDFVRAGLMSKFVAELIDTDGDVTLLSNSNFCHVQDEKYKEVYV